MQRRVEFVFKKEDCIIALVKEDGKELGKVFPEPKYCMIERPHCWIQTFQLAGGG
jgi:hypothetical protein